jgi:hypothetical protein
MRSVALLIAVVGVAVPIVAWAAPTLPNRTEAVSARDIVLVDRRCGPGGHWIRSGYGKHGKWRSAHCTFGW